MHLSLWLSGSSAHMRLASLCKMKYDNTTLCTPRVAGTSWTNAAAISFLWSLLTLLCTLRQICREEAICYVQVRPLNLLSFQSPWCSLNFFAQLLELPMTLGSFVRIPKSVTLKIWKLSVCAVLQSPLIHTEAQTFMILSMRTFLVPNLGIPYISAS